MASPAATNVLGNSTSSPGKVASVCGREVLANSDRTASVGKDGSLGRASTASAPRFDAIPMSALIRLTIASDDRAGSVSQLAGISGVVIAFSQA